MTYTISEVAEMFDLSTHTLRFYDKEGLLPFISKMITIFQNAAT